MRKFLIFLICLASSIAAFTNINDKNIVYVFAHGMGGDKNQAKYYTYYDILAQGQVEGFNFCDVVDNSFDQNKSSFGQTSDIETLKATYENISDEQLDIILCGVSRGAATILNFAGTHNDKKISAIIAESPFAHIDDVIEGFSQNIPILKIVPMFIQKKIMQSMYPAYNPQGEQPINLVKNIDKNTPIALICSKGDTLISYRSTIELYKALKTTGHHNTELLILEDGSHANLMNNPTYKQFIHAFYKKNNLPHNEQWAQEGEKYLGNIYFKSYK